MSRATTANDNEMTESSPPQSSNAEDFVLVARCEPCPCPFGSGPHLTIDLQRVKLDRQNAVAVSYTWGEFDRRDVYMGHRGLQPHRKIFMNLGREWSVPELWDRLSELSMEYHAIWVDQLCIPQTKGEIRDS